MISSVRITVAGGWLRAQGERRAAAELGRCVFWSARLEELSPSVTTNAAAPASLGATAPSTASVGGRC
jgi:hypothetical protein